MIMAQSTMAQSTSQDVRDMISMISDTLDTCDTLYIKARALGKND